MDLTEEDKGDRFRLKSLFDKRQIRPQTKEAFFNYEPNDLMIAQDKETFVVVSHDMAIAHPLFMHGESDLSKLVHALGLLDTDIDVLWDIGANIGSICIPAVNRGLVKRAVAFEPEERLHRLLKVNAILNGVDALIECHRVALGDADGTAALMVGEGNTGDYRIAGRMLDDDSMGENDRRTEMVTVRTMDDFASSFESERTLIFMDIQGYEGIALRGASQLLANSPPLVCEFWPYAMKRLDSYPPFREAVCTRYLGFANLSAPEEGFRELDARVLDDLYEQVGENSRCSTDLLFVSTWQPGRRHVTTQSTRKPEMSDIPSTPDELVVPMNMFLADIDPLRRRYAAGDERALDEWQPMIWPGYELREKRKDPKHGPIAVLKKMTSVETRLPSEQEQEAWFSDCDFTTDWSSRAFPDWERHLARYRDRPSAVLEIGAWEGRGSLWLLNFLPQANITCLDIFTFGNEGRFDANVMRSTHGDRVRKIKGRSAVELDNMGAAGDKFDIIYLDGSHLRDDVITDSLLAWRLLNVGGILMWDDYQLIEAMPGHFDRPEQDPKPAIDLFLQWHGDELEVVHRAYQLFVRKTKPHFDGLG